MSDTTGSVIGFTVEGQSFNVAADANLSRIPTRTEKSKIPTSGKSMTKAVRRIPTIEGLICVLNAADGDALKNYAEANDDKQLSVTYAGGETYQGLGEINLETHESEENRYTVSLHPSEDWTLFTA